MSEINGFCRKLEDFKIIRELSFAESLYDNEVVNNNSFQTRTFITQIDNRYQINMDLLNKTLKLWIQMHPLLQATIYRQIDPSTQKPKLGLPRYFVYMKKSIDDYRNVKMLQETDYLKWTDLIESELKSSLDYINGPLWKIKVLKMMESQEGLKRYAFILTTSHSITDGRNGYSIGVQFLDLLIDVLENSTSVEINQMPSEFNMDQLIQEYKKRPDIKIIDEKPEIDRSFHRLPNNVGYKKGIHGRFDYIFLQS